METVVRIVQVVLGVGLLVFIHELGHFLAARLCRVRVLVFSLGFGPRLWGFVRNGTEYRVAVVPVGGYVRMVGDAGDQDRLVGDDGALSEKPAWQRFFVYSAGILMNLALAFVILPLAFAAGIPFQRPVIGSVTAGSPAWRAGVVPGSLVREVNGTEIYAFEQLHSEIALSDGPIRLELDEPAAGPSGAPVRRVLDVPAEYSASAGIPTIGIQSAARIVPAAGSAGRLGAEVGVADKSAAFEAGVRTGDLLLEADGIAVDYDSLGAVARAFHRKATLRFEPGPKSPARPPDVFARLAAGVVLEPRVVGAASTPSIGVQMPSNVVAATRHDPTIDALDLRAGDRILELNGRPVASGADVEDVVRALDPAGALEMRIRRGEQTRVASAPLPPDARRRFLASVALTVDEGATRVAVIPGSPAERAGLRAGDRIERVGDAPIASFADIRKALAKASGRPAPIFVAREAGDATERLTVTVTPEKAPERTTGLELVEDKTLVKASSLGHAFALGFRASIVSVVDVTLFLKKIALGEVAASKSLGGPISIAHVTFRITEQGVAKLFFVLAVLSINLALINLLPIPVLDGGNLLFVIVEKIKGSPVSDRVLGASQTVGVFLLIALMVWVTFHDVRNVFGIP